jgi:hypothetical protein
MWRGTLAAVLIGLAIYVGYQFLRAQPKPDSAEEREICLGQNSYTYELDGKRYALPFDVIDDQAVVEGDIILGQAADVQKGGANYVAPVVPNYIRGEPMRWESHLVPYIIDASVTASDRALIQQAITAWQRATNVRFRQLTGTRDWQTESYVKFSGKKAQCTSNSLGVKERLSGKANEEDNINVVEVAGCGQNWGHIAHQIGHVLGLGHEHSRGDRDSYITILWSNIDGPKQFCRAIWDQQALANTTYDYDSIMHYAPGRAAKRSSGCKKVIYDGKEDCLAFLPNQERLEQQRQTLGRSIRPGQRDHLSEEDIARVNTLYPASSPASSLAIAPPCTRTITTSSKAGDRTTTTTVKTEPCSLRSQKTMTEPSSIRPPCCWDGEASNPPCRPAACPAVGVRWPRPDRWCRPGWCRPWPRPRCDRWLEARWERPPFDGWDDRW